MTGLTACDNGTTTIKAPTNDSAKPAAPVATNEPQSKLGSTGTPVLMNLVNKYYNLKNALVATKSVEVGTAATQLLASADSMVAFLQTDKTNEPALRPYIDTIIAQSKVVNSVKDESCEKQRTAFSGMTGAIFGLVKKAELKHAHIYQQFCPMAMNDKGAYWLSDIADVKNPYYGKKMLECGEVTDSLQ